MSLPLPAHRFADRAKISKSSGAHNFAFDIDGVIDSFPREMATMISALTAAAHRVFIITGADGETVAPSEVKAKREYLISLGISPEMYYELIVLPQPHAENKAKAIAENDIGVLIDNSKENIKAASSKCVALLLWNSKEA